MADTEKTQEDVPRGTFATRMAKISEEAREAKSKLAHKKQKEKFAPTDREKEFAKLVLQLMDNEQFRRYLEFEAIEVGRLCAEAFTESTEMKDATFGEKMAFNKGRVFQMKHFSNMRNNVVSKYLEFSKIDKEV